PPDYLIPTMSSALLPLAAFGFGGAELLIILFIILLLFGGSKLPALAKGLGESVREFKKAAKDEEPAEKKTEEKKTPETTGKN
ncbi:MAG: twin-arginine translocase TatA/TatE family subunit, partial [Opitutales bacterium]